MTERKVLARRTLGSGPPADLLFGEIAYSDGDKQFYVGRPESEAPTTFQGDLDLTPITEELAQLAATTNNQGTAIAALAASDSAQNTSIATLGSGLITLNNSQTIQGEAIATLQARPIVHGFTYDQQAEPISPPVGATWRERSVGGLILNVWEWTGSVWAEPMPRSIQEIRTTNLTATAINTFVSLIPPRLSRCSRILTLEAVLTVQTSAAATWDETNYYDFAVSGRGININGELVGSIHVGTLKGSSTPGAHRPLSLTIPINEVLLLPQATNTGTPRLVRFNVASTKFNTAPDLLTPVATINYKGVR